MKVVDMLKHKGESFTRHNLELVDKKLPLIKDYWHELLKKAHTQSLLQRFVHMPSAINEDETVVVEEQIVMHPEAKLLYDELHTTLGEVYHVGEWLEVSQERINAFADVTEDHQWIHTDPVRAEVESPFKTTIAHGFLTLALLPVLTDSVNPDTPQFPTAKVVVNMGLNKVLFPYPLKSGNRVRASSAVISIKVASKGAALDIVREIKVEIEGVRRPACVVESVIRLKF